MIKCSALSYCYESVCKIYILNLYFIQGGYKEYSTLIHLKLPENNFHFFNNIL